MPEPVVKTEDKTTPTMPTIPKFVRGQKVFLKDENMKPYIVKKQDPYNPNKWHIQSMHGNGLAHELKIVDEENIFMAFRIR